MSEETNHSDGDKPAVPSNPLLGCPFCGGTARLDKSVVFKTPVVFCLKCNAAMGREYGSAFKTQEEVTKAWNRRHPNPTADRRATAQDKTHE